MSASRARGVVLLSVLLVLALLSALVWQLMGRHSFVIAQSRFSFVNDQTLEYVLGGEAFARQVLVEEWRAGGAGKDTLLEPWAQPTRPFPVDNGFIEIQVRDLHSCFNLNSLMDQGRWQQNLNVLKTLLIQHDLPVELADAWRDWIDPDQDIHGFGAEDGEYLLENPSYRTANQPAADVSELRLVRGADPQALAAVEDLLCVVPDTELSINVNTAGPEVLAALGSSLTVQQMTSFTGQDRDFDDVGQVTGQFPALDGAVDALSVTSEYFEVNVRARIDDSQSELTSVLRRSPTNGEITLISRNLGRNFRSLFATDEAEDEAT